MKPASHKKRNTIIAFTVIIMLLLVGAGTYFFYFKKTLNITSYQACVAAGNPIMASFPPQCKTPDGKTFTDTNAATTIEGTAVCLPHKETNGPQTLECAVGIMATDGTYYGISGDKEHKLSRHAGSDQKIRVTGTIENVNDTIYDIAQLIAVRNIEEITD